MGVGGILLARDGALFIWKEIIGEIDILFREGCKLSGKRVQNLFLEINKKRSICKPKGTSISLLSLSKRI